MKKKSSTNVFPIMLLGTGPIALLLWAGGFSGETVFILWLVTGIIMWFAMNPDNK